MPLAPWESHLMASDAYLLALFSNSCGAKLKLSYQFELKICKGILEGKRV